MSDEETATEEHAEDQAPDNSESDGNVTADWQVAVIPNENVSIHYIVAPVDGNDAVTSVSASFVLMKDGLLQHSYAGSSTQELISPKAGQGVTGDCGVDSSVFPAERDGELVAILAGTARKGETTVNYFFEKSFDPTI